MPTGSSLGKAGHDYHMRCPHCDQFESTVVESQDRDSGVRRERECAHCHQRFTTLEQLQRALVTVVKRDGRREDFQRNKLLHGLSLAARKRPLPAGALEAIVDDIEGRLVASGRAEIASRVIGEMAITHLRRLDPIAYIRYSSIYRQFVSIDDMIDQLAEMAALPLPPVEQPRLFSDDIDTLVSGDEGLPRAPTPIETRRAALGV